MNQAAITLLVGQWRLHGADNARERAKKSEDRQRARREPDEGRADYEEGETGQRHAPHTPTVHHTAEKRRRDRAKKGGQGQCKRDRGARPRHIRRDRLEKYTGSEEQDGAIANGELRHCAGDHTPRIGKPLRSREVSYDAAHAFATFARTIACTSRSSGAGSSTSLFTSLAEVRSVVSLEKAQVGQSSEDVGCE